MLLAYFMKNMEANDQLYWELYNTTKAFPF